MISSQTTDINPFTFVKQTLRATHSRLRFSTSHYLPEDITTLYCILEHTSEDEVAVLHKIVFDDERGVVKNIEDIKEELQHIMDCGFRFRHVYGIPSLPFESDVYSEIARKILTRLRSLWTSHFRAPWRAHVKVSFSRVSILDPSPE